MPDFDTQIREHAVAFANDLAAIVRQNVAEEVLRVLGSKPLPSKRAPRVAAKTSVGKSRAASKKVSDEQVLAAIKGQKDGASASEVAKATGLKGAAVGYRVNKLRSAKKVRTTGQRSAMRYFVVA